MRMSEEEFTALRQRQEAMGVRVTETTKATPRTSPVTREEKAACVAPLPVAKGNVEIAFSGNKTEAAYMNLLEGRKRAGEIATYRFESHTLKLAKDTRYTPDFQVMLADGRIEFHEVKGEFVREDSWVKLKTAAAIYPEYRFVFAQKTKKEGWKIKEVTEF